MSELQKEVLKQYTIRISTKHIEVLEKLLSEIENPIKLNEAINLCFKKGVESLANKNNEELNK